MCIPWHNYNVLVYKNIALACRGARLSISERRHFDAGGRRLKKGAMLTSKLAIGNFLFTAFRDLFWQVRIFCFSNIHPFWWLAQQLKSFLWYEWDKMLWVAKKVISDTFKFCAAVLMHGRPQTLFMKIFVMTEVICLKYTAWTCKNIHYIK